MNREVNHPVIPSSVTGSSVTVKVRVHERDTSSSDSVEEVKAVRAPVWILRAAVLVAVLAIAGIYAGIRIGNGWVPADDGTLSQSALRVLQGQLPHRDFGEIYTGGLSFIHALAFRAFGVNLMSLRICVFLFFLAWVPSVYAIALRFASPIAAGAVTLLAVAWSYPNYPAAMPSWYNLFFATFGALALLRYLDVRTRRWLFVAGLCGAASILIKVIGAYYVAAVLLFLAFLEQTESSSRTTDQSPNAESKSDLLVGWPYRLFSVAALLLFLGVLVHVLGARLGTAELYQFVLPSVLLVGTIMAGEKRIRAGSIERFQSMLHFLLPFLAGLFLPIALFLIPYAKSGMVHQFLFGVTASAASRSVVLGVIRPVGLEGIVWLLPLAVVLFASMYWDKFQSIPVGAALGLGAALILYRATQSAPLVSGIWTSAAVLTPAVVLFGVVILWPQRKAATLNRLKHQQLALLISLAAICSLVQFPFAAPIYLSYALPLTILALLAIVSVAKTQRGTFAYASVVLFYVAFAGVCLVPRYIYELTYQVGRLDAMQNTRSGGLKVDGAVFWDQFSEFLRQHSPNGMMFAGNDCPELYFLSGLKAVTYDDGAEPPDEIVKAIHSETLNLVVINDATYFSGTTMTPEMKAELANRFPHTAHFGIFQVFWKR